MVDVPIKASIIYIRRTRVTRFFPILQTIKNRITDLVLAQVSKLYVFELLFILSMCYILERMFLWQ